MTRLAFVWLVCAHAFAPMPSLSPWRWRFTSPVGAERDKGVPLDLRGADAKLGLEPFEDYCEGRLRAPGDGCAFTEEIGADGVVTSKAKTLSTEDSFKRIQGTGYVGNGTVPEFERLKAMAIVDGTGANPQHERHFIFFVEAPKDKNRTKLARTLQGLKDAHRYFTRVGFDVVGAVCAEFRRSTILTSETSRQRTVCC